MQPQKKIETCKYLKPVDLKQIDGLFYCTVERPVFWKNYFNSAGI
jgi:hypothetical protein